MVGSKTIKFATGFAAAAFLVAGSVNANQTPNPSQQSKPVDRGFGQHDACFGDKYESDEDLKTGNDISIEEILKLLDTPGT